MIKIKIGIIFILIITSVLSITVELQNGINNYLGNEDLTLYNNENKAFIYMTSYGAKPVTSEAAYIASGVFGC